MPVLSYRYRLEILLNSALEDLPSPTPAMSGPAQSVLGAEDEGGQASPLHATALEFQRRVLHSSPQLCFHQWEVNPGLFINCGRKCLYVYSPESSGAGKSFL